MPEAKGLLSTGEVSSAPTASALYAASASSCACRAVLSAKASPATNGVGKPVTAPALAPTLPVTIVPPLFPADMPRATKLEAAPSDGCAPAAGTTRLTITLRTQNGHLEGISASFFKE